MGIVEGVLLATSVGGQVGSAIKGHSAEKKGKKARAIELAAMVREAERKKQQVAERARAIRATVVNTAEQTGAEGSSAVAGRAGAIVSSAGEQLSTITTNTMAGLFTSDLTQQAEDDRGDAALFDAVGSVADFGMKVSGGYQKIFGEDAPGPQGVTATGSYGRGLGVLKR